MPPVAHSGHWLIEALYTLPVLVIVVWISIKTVLDRRREARDDLTPVQAPEDRAPDPPA